MEEPDRDEERGRRLAFAISPIHEPPEGLVVKWLDSEDPDERKLLLRAAHPELDFESETVVVDGQEMNPGQPCAGGQAPPSGRAGGAPAQPTTLNARRSRRRQSRRRADHSPASHSSRSRIRRALSLLKRSAR